MIETASPEPIATAIIDSNRYMTLATAGADGLPWASPVFYSADRYRDFYWMSSPGVRHSQNIAARPEVGIVVFDSQARVGTAQAVYMSAVAEELAGDELERGLEVYPGSAERGGWAITAEDVQPPSDYRLYRARVSERSILCPRDGGPCAEHGLAFDHRTTVEL